MRAGIGGFEKEIGEQETIQMESDRWWRGPSRLRALQLEVLGGQRSHEWE